MIVNTKPYDGSFSALITREVVPRHLQTFATTNLHQNTSKQEKDTNKFIEPAVAHLTTCVTITSLFASSSSARPVIRGLGVGQEMKAGAEMYNRQLNTSETPQMEACDLF